jgi:hypothetical protein
MATTAAPYSQKSYGKYFYLFLLKTPGPRKSITVGCYWQQKNFYSFLPHFLIITSIYTLFCTVSNPVPSTVLVTQNKITILFWPSIGLSCMIWTHAGRTCVFSLQIRNSFLSCELCSKPKQIFVLLQKIDPFCTFFHTVSSATRLFNNVVGCWNWTRTVLAFHYQDLSKNFLSLYILFFSASYYYGYFGSIFSFIVLFIIMWYLLSGRGERLDIGFVVFFII